MQLPISKFYIVNEGGAFELPLISTGFKDPNPSLPVTDSGFRRGGGVDPRGGGGREHDLPNFPKK